MSDDPKRPDEAEGLNRYQRRGGSARKDEPRGGLWQRVRDWVGTDAKRPDAEDKSRPLTAESDDAPRTEQAPEPAAKAAPQTSTGPERLAVELVLPSGQRVVLLVTAPNGRGGGLLQLEIEPPPANDPRIVKALTTVGYGGEEPEPAPEPSPAAEEGHQLPPIDRPHRQPTGPMQPAGVDALGPRPRRPTGPVLPPEPRPRPPSGPATPTPGRPKSIELPPPRPREPRPSDTIQGLPDLEPITPAAPEPAPPSEPLRPAAPTEEAEPRRRRLRPAAARGGAAGAMFDDEPPPAPPAQPEPPPPTKLQRPGSPAAPAKAPRPDEPPPPRQAAGKQGFYREEPTPAEPPLFPDDGADEPTREHRQDQPASEPSQPQVPLYPQSTDELGPPPSDPDQDDEDRAIRPGLRSSQLPIVGIDFGTSYSSIALMRAGLEVIPDENGDILLPSVISFPNPGETLIGWEARNRMGGEAQFTIVSPKRLLGRLYKDPQVAQLLGGLAFRTFAGTDKFVRFEAHGEIYSVTDICAMILGRLRERACRYLDAEVSKAVFAVPVGFGTLQRSALEVAARKAGLEPVGLVTEPSAAVLAHGFRSQRGMVAVYDFGGGTFDFSVLEVSETAFQVLCAGGDPWLGGDDFDNVIASNLADRFWKETGVDLRNRAVEWQALIFACEQAKRILSSKSAAEVRVDNLLHTAKGSKGLRYKVARKHFVGLAEPLIEKSISIAGKVMAQAGISPKHVDGVVLTGGTSLIPAVREAVAKFFGRKPIEGDPDLAVVRGASLRAAELKGEAVAETSMGGRTLREVAGRTIGAGPKGGQVVTLFERDTPLPAEVFKAFYTQFDGQTEMVIGLYEESKSRIDESRTIGHLRYKGLRDAPAGEARIDFTFYLDEDGILHVTAVVEGKEYTKSIRLE